VYDAIDRYYPYWGSIIIFLAVLFNILTFVGKKMLRRVDESAYRSAGGGNVLDYSISSTFLYLRFLLFGEYKNIKDAKILMIFRACHALFVVFLVSFLPVFALVAVRSLIGR